MKMQTREHYRDRMADLRDQKRAREEAKRWERFLMDRAEFDEEIFSDVYDYMMRNERD